jgi:hypothetical protein
VSELLVRSPDLTYADFYLLVYVIGLIITNGGRHSQAIYNAYMFTKLFVFSIASKGFYFEYYLGYQIEKNEIADCVRRMWQRKDAYRVLVRKPEGKRPLGKRNHR